MNNTTQTQRTVGVAIFAAIIITLQIFATAVNFVTPGTIPIALVLPPIVIGAAMYGVKAGALLGFCFGAVVLGSGITGTAPTSAMMWSVNPLIMTVGTLGRGVAAGFTAGMMYKIFSKRNAYLGVLAAAIATPVVNTGIFVIVLFLFLEILVAEGSGRTLMQYAASIMIAFNFMLEVIVNVVLGPTIARMIGIAKMTRAQSVS
ncbi:MAG: ECF transporter S component [Defluviitaleaceae bacterium]|nr:ECF transporter S component [Defluviitaleaceae bacterium]